MEHTASPKNYPATLKADEQELRTIVADLRSDFTKLRDAALEAGRDKVSSLKSNASETLEDKKQQAGEVADRLADSIREAPLKSMLIAAGAGILYGMIHRRG